MPGLDRQGLSIDPDQLDRFRRHLGFLQQLQQAIAWLKVPDRHPVRWRRLAALCDQSRDLSDARSQIQHTHIAKRRGVIEDQADALRVEVRVSSGDQLQATAVRRDDLLKRRRLRRAAVQFDEVTQAMLRHQAQLNGVCALASRSISRVRCCAARRRPH